MDPIKFLTDSIGTDYNKLLTVIAILIQESNVDDERVIFLNNFITNEYTINSKD